MPIDLVGVICPTCKTSNQPGTVTCTNCGGMLAVTKPFVPNKSHRAGMVAVGILFALPAMALGLWYLTKEKPEIRDEGRYLIIGSSVTLVVIMLFGLLSKLVFPPS
ncbi:MAG: hypothetical protein ACYC0V_19615 [Armatimonadota bacterium]